MNGSALFRFLEKLSENNNRPWFQAHKAEFDELRAEWLADIDRLIAAMSEWEPRYRWLTARECTYRIYRDTRFSPDKTPYKTYFSAGFSPAGKSSSMAGYYISAGLGDCGIYGGIWAPDREALRKMRHAIVDNIEEFEGIINDKKFKKAFPAWFGPTLKTIPKGWAKDHEQAHLLRLLHYGREHELKPAYFDDLAWPEKAAETMRLIKPLVDFINYSLFEE